MLSRVQLDERVNALSRVNLFADLGTAALENLSDITEKQVISKGKKIYSIGEDCKFMFIVIKGMVKICRKSEDGREVIKSIISPYSVFGESGLYEEKSRLDSAVALESGVQILAINIANFREYMRSDWNLTYNIVKFLGQRKSMAEKRFESVVLNDARTRIIDFLKDNANKLGTQIGFEMLIKHSLTQQDIANFTGTSRQTVTSVLNDLKKSNQIYFKRKSILIRDMETLS